jgi:PEP-CTERM motif
MKALARIVSNVIVLNLVLFFSESVHAGPTYPVLVFVLPSSSFVGYDGGSVCSLTDSSCDGLSSGALLGPGPGYCGSPVADCVESASFSLGTTAGVFDLSGTLADGAVLGGTMTLDEGADTVTAVNFTVGTPYSFTATEITYDGIDSGFRLLEAGVSGAAVATPEPSTWALMLVGFGGLGLAALRQASKARRATTTA